MPKELSPMSEFLQSSGTYARMNCKVIALSRWYKHAYKPFPNRWFIIVLPILPQHWSTLNWYTYMIYPHEFITQPWFGSAVLCRQGAFWLPDGWTSRATLWGSGMDCSMALMALMALGLQSWWRWQFSSWRPVHPCSEELFFSVRHSQVQFRVVEYGIV